VLPLRHRDDGFTLFELLIVVAVMGLVAAIYLRGLTAGALPFEIRTAARVLAAELEYAGQRAIATGAPHRWVVDLDRQRFRLERELETPPPDPTEATHAGLLDLTPPRPTREIVPVANRAGEWRRLDQDPDSVWIESARGAEDEEKAGEVAIAFSPDGGADPAQLELEDAYGRRMLLRVIAFTGEVRVEEPEGA
jgi:type II secretion system protein H